MLDGIDFEKDAMGLMREEEFICGSCKHTMMPISKDRYQCPKCGAVFEDGLDLA